MSEVSFCSFEIFKSTLSAAFDTFAFFSSALKPIRMYMSFFEDSYSVWMSPKNKGRQPISNHIISLPIPMSKQ